MEPPKTFEILKRKKIPYWSSLLFGAIIICFFILFLVYFFMLPSGRTSGEMKVGYFILVIPEWLKWASAYSFLGLIFLIPVYIASKAYKSFLITIENDEFIITGDVSDKRLPVQSIKKIMINDKRPFISSREVTEIVINQFGNKTTSFLLKHYIQTEELIEAFSVFPNIEFVFYNDMFIAHLDDE